MEGRNRGEKRSCTRAGRDYISTMNIDKTSEEIKVFARHQKATYTQTDKEVVGGKGGQGRSFYSH